MEEVGIGTSRPSYMLHVTGTIGGGNFIDAASYASQGSSIMRLESNILQIGDYGDGFAVQIIGPGSVPVISINNTPNIGINTTEALMPNLIHVYGRTLFNGTLNTSGIVITPNICVDGQVLKWSSGVGICGTDSTGTANISGSGATGYIPKFHNDTHLVPSVIFTDNTSIGIRTTTLASTAALTIDGNRPRSISS